MSLKLKKHLSTHFKSFVQLFSIFWAYIYRKHFIDAQSDKILVEGDTHTRKSYANTLRTLSKEGYKTFYGGRIGRQIIKELQKLGSKFTIQELMDYR